MKVLMAVLLAVAPAVAWAQGHAGPGSSCRMGPAAQAVWAPGAPRAVGRNTMTVSQGAACSTAFSMTGRTLSYAEQARAPAHGTLAVDGGRVTYTPQPGFVGNDQFVVRVPSAEWTIDVVVLPR